MEDEDKSIAERLKFPWQQVLDADNDKILNSQLVSLCEFCDINNAK